MDLLQSLLYGLLSGVSEFMPISSFGHQAMLRRLFGASYWDPAMDLFVHMALCLAALLVFRGNIDGRTGYAYTERLTEEAIPFLVNMAKENAALLSPEDMEEYPIHPLYAPSTSNSFRQFLWFPYFHTFLKF